MIVLLQIFSCFFLTGLIWVIQLVHYPSFLFVREERFQTFGRFHSWRISCIVMPLMIVELLSAIALVWSSPEVFWIVNLILVMSVWTFTFVLSVPRHQRLAQGFSLIEIESLILTNWPRTIVWSLRSCGLAIWLLPKLQ
ncbi:MAG: hypothetical protein AB7F86_19320 [Bdellovibrionales bacterium]